MKLPLEFFIIRSRIISRIRGIFNNQYDKLLDIGSGSDADYHEFIKGKLVSFDIKKSGKSHVIGDADFLPFRKASFNKIICVNSFYYFKNPFKVVGYIHNALKQNGKLVMVLPFFYPVHDKPVDRYRFTERGLRTILEEKFRIEKIEAIGGLFTLPSVALHSMIKGIPSVFPPGTKFLASFISLVLWPFYFVSQFLSLLDFLDSSERIPTYYFVVAAKK